MATFDLYAELGAVTAALDASEIEHAICGALALAVHGYPRATKDIDVIVPRDQLANARAVARACGFTLSALPMKFSATGLEVQRVSKLENGELLMLDLLLVDESLESVWASREQLPWLDGTLWCISRDALVSMKLAAGRPQDLADVARLAESS